jgi:hypothetical protein
MLKCRSRNNATRWSARSLNNVIRHGSGTNFGYLIHSVFLFEFLNSSSGPGVYDMHEWRREDNSTVHFSAYRSCAFKKYEESDIKMSYFIIDNRFRRENAFAGHSRHKPSRCLQFDGLLPKAKLSKAPRHARPISESTRSSQSSRPRQLSASVHSRASFGASRKSLSGAVFRAESLANGSTADWVGYISDHNTLRICVIVSSLASLLFYGRAHFIFIASAWD